MRRNLTFQLRIALFAAMHLAIAAPAVMAQATFQEEAGTLPDGTPYRMRMPAGWNGILISDLDYADVSQGQLRADDERNMFFLDQGYAIVGTARHPRREYEYDPAAEVANLVAVMDMFEAKWDEADRIIQYGHSGGGYVTLAMAETRPDRIHGAVAGCGHVPVWLASTSTDYWFVLKSLLAPELEIADLPEDTAELTAAWREVLEQSQQTPLGRARIALAATIGQLPAWPGADHPKPDPNDVESLQAGMYGVLMRMPPGGAGRFMFEQAGGGQPASNVGTDYAALFDNGEETHKRAVLALYRQAGAELAADLERVNAAPRIAASQSALDWWAAVPGRLPNGMPKVPVLRMHTVGDLAVPISLLEGYAAEVRETGNEALYRSAVVDGAGHCTFTAGESAAAIRTVLDRIETGRWNTEPEQLNRLGDSYGHGTSRFIEFSQKPYNHARFRNVSERE